MTLSTSELFIALGGAGLGLLVAMVGWGLKRAINEVDKKLVDLTLEIKATTKIVNEHTSTIGVHEFRLNALDGKGPSTPVAKRD